jgi:hypothetical protein
MLRLIPAAVATYGDRGDFFAIRPAVGIDSHHRDRDDGIQARAAAEGAGKIAGG